jgi:hypothetical protein
LSFNELRTKNRILMDSKGLILISGNANYRTNSSLISQN